MLYFAYGSNLSTPRLRQRLGAFEILTTAQLPGHALRFHKVSDVDGSGKCDAFHTAHNDDVVYGVVYVIDNKQMATLDRIEGHNRGYRRTPVRVRTGQGQLLEVVTYCATVIDPRLKPMHWYHYHVCHGAAEHRLPQAYREWLQQVGVQVDADQQRTRRELAMYPHAVTPPTAGGLLSFGITPADAE